MSYILGKTFSWQKGKQQMPKHLTAFFHCSESTIPEVASPSYILFLHRPSYSNRNKASIAVGSDSAFGVHFLDNTSLDSIPKISRFQQPSLALLCLFFGVFFFVQFNVPFKIISLISRRANQKVGWKREYPGKNHLTHPQVELDLSHLWPLWGSNPHQSQRWDDRMVKGDNEISHLNHSATCFVWFDGLCLL